MANEFDRYYIKIRTILGIDTKTIHEELTTALGPNAPSYRTVARWANRFREGRENVNDDPRSGRRVSELTDENIELEIWKQRKSAGIKGVKLLHDNAGLHRHSDVINYLTEEGINIMPHPPYSPDLAPCDYWLNDYIKCNLSDQPNEKSLARAVSKVVKNIPKEEFTKTFDKLLGRMELCINNHGDYFEHLIK
ncbi:unnamed protein product [Rotaria sp. Silwood1]|nr:unnamed protein product [Rotaria sp. Silwood1]